jgi:hypothetical protein
MRADVDSPEHLAALDDRLKVLDAFTVDVNTDSHCRPARWRGNFARPRVLREQCTAGVVQRGGVDGATRLQCIQVTLCTFPVIEGQRRLYGQRKNRAFGADIRRPRGAVVMQIDEQQRGARGHQRDGRGCKDYNHELAAE